MGTLSKAAGAYGGYVCGPEALMQLLVSRARSFVYTTGLPPPVLAAAITALEIIETEPERGAAARRHARLFTDLMGLPAPQSVIVPVIIGDNRRTMEIAAAFFVTATGTDIGKTYLSARLLAACRASGMLVAATKPVMSGFSEAELEQSDAGRLLAAMGEAVTPEAVSRICLHRLTPPLAPNIAMRQAGIRQDYQEILRFVRMRLSSETDLHLVEGAGGVMSPLTDDSLQTDLMAALGLPVILVTAPYLGSISHTLTAMDAIAARGLALAALVVSEPVPGGPDPDAFRDELIRIRKVPAFALPNGADCASLKNFICE